PNRFVRFALERWRSIVAATRDALLRETESQQVARGLRESTAMLEYLDVLLSDPLFREVGSLTGFPRGNPVLQRREGYRDLYEAYIESEVAGKLAWDGGEDVYSAGQRNVATLYEFWVFLQFAQIIGDVCDQDFDPTALVRLGDTGLSLTLRRGKALS